MIEAEVMHNFVQLLPHKFRLEVIAAPVWSVAP